MAQFICPSCGSEYFIASKTGPKNVFNVIDERAVQFVQLAADAAGDVHIDNHNIYCGACTWQGSLDEVVESHTD